MPFKTIEQQKKEIQNILVCFPFITVLTDGHTSLIVEGDSNTVADVLMVYLSAKGYKTRDGSANGQFYIDLVEPTITIAELAQKISKFNEAYPQYSTSTMDAFVDFLGMERPQ